MTSDTAKLLSTARVTRDERPGSSGLLRFLLEVPAPAGHGSADDLFVALRNAIAHEGHIADMLASTGATMDVGELVSILSDALRSIAGHHVSPATTPLPRTEAAALLAVGIDTADIRAARIDPRISTAAQYASLVATSLTTREAAELLGVEESRIRQRLLERTLYGVKRGRAWRLPRFQFDAQGALVAGLECVLPHLPTDIHPVAVWRWLTEPSPDLVDDGESMAPLQWLASGRDPEPVAAMAREL